MDFLLLTSSAIVGAALSYLFHRIKVGGYKRLSADILRTAEQEAETMRKDGEIAIKQEQLQSRRELEKSLSLEKRKIQKEAERLGVRESKLEDRVARTESKMAELEKEKKLLDKAQKKLENAQETHREKSLELTRELENLAGITGTEAKDKLLKTLADDVQNDAAAIKRKAIAEAKEKAKTEATRIIGCAIERMAVSHVSDAAVTTVVLPNEEMKARIIGREGRNIRALEQATGVNFIVDEVAGAIVLSAFDPVRRHIAKTALTELIVDGRIHPSRIEEAVANAKEDIDQQIKEAGEDAAWRAGAIDLSSEIITLLGKLKFRTSHGQNALDHSLEVSHLMGLIAAELSLDVSLAQRIGLLHDIGKALSHDMRGSHALVGHNIALRYGEMEEVANGIGCHHGEMEPISAVASLCCAADALSASRPGARVEAVGEYIKRMQALEEIATTFPGVDKAYSVQAGRELRVIVLPEMVDDGGTLNLAHDITRKIEEKLNTPSRVKVTLIREKRVTAHTS